MMSNNDSGNKKSMFKEILLEGGVKVTAEIVGGLLLFVVCFFFPFMKSWLTDPVQPKNATDRVVIVISQDTKPPVTSQTELQKDLERLKQEEERLNAELKRKEEALKEVEAHRVDEERKRAELQRQLEAQQAEEARRKAEPEKPKRPAMSDEEFLELCETGDAVKVAEAIRNGANVNARNNIGSTALIYAAYEGHTETARVLLQNGADVNARDNSGETALMEAAWKGHKETARLLLQSGANVNARDNIGETALRWATRYRHAKTANLLRSYGAKE